MAMTEKITHDEREFWAIPQLGGYFYFDSGNDILLSFPMMENGSADVENGAIHVDSIEEADAKRTRLYISSVLDLDLKYENTTLIMRTETERNDAEDDDTLYINPWVENYEGGFPTFSRMYDESDPGYTRAPIEVYWDRFEEYIQDEDDIEKKVELRVEFSRAASGTDYIEVRP